MINLKTLKLDTFMNAVMTVNEHMSDARTCDRLLDAAAKDTPVIDELLQDIRQLQDHEDGPQKEKGLATAQRDLTVFLALRKIGQVDFSGDLPRIG